MKKNYGELFDLLKRKGTASVRDPVKPESINDRKLREEQLLWCATQFGEFSRLLTQAGNTEFSPMFTAEAKSFYEQFIQMRPEETLALAEFLAKTTEIDLALNLLQEQIGKSSTSRVLGAALAVRNNPEATESQLARLQDLLGQNMQSHNQSVNYSIFCADLMSWRGDDRGSKNLYLEILRRDGRNIAAMNNLAFLLSLTGRDQNEAKRLVEKAIELGGPMDTLIDTLGMVFLAGGHPEKAIVEFNKSVGENKSAEHLFHLALALAQLKQFKDAQKSLDEAGELGLSRTKLNYFERTTFDKLRDELTRQASR